MFTADAVAVENEERKALFFFFTFPIYFTWVPPEKKLFPVVFFMNKVIFVVRFSSTFVL